MQNELKEIKDFLFNASPSEMRHGLVRLVDFLINYINHKEEVTPQGESQRKKNGRKSTSTD